MLMDNVPRHFDAFERDNVQIVISSQLYKLEITI